MVSVGTNPLLRKGSRVRNIGVLLAVSTLLAARPSAADSQISATANNKSTPAVASALAWLATAGVLLLFAVALIWLSAALGLAAKSVETASNTPMFLTLLPFLSSGFVPTDTMLVCLRHFAEYEPFTPVTQTVRGLLTDNPIGTHAIVAVAWSAGITIASYLWAVRLYNRRRAAGSN